MEKVVNYIEPKTKMVVTFRKVLLFCLCFIPISLFAQQEILKKKIVIPQNNYSSIELIQYIQKTANIEFSYKTKLLQDLKTSKYKGTSETLYDILNQITEGEDLDFVVINGVVVIKSKKEIQKIIKKTKSSNPQAKIEYVERESKSIEKAQVKTQKIVSGRVVDSESGEIQIGATIYITDLKISVNTNEYGFFSFPIPEGNFKMQVIVEGYYLEEINVASQNPENITIQVHSSSYKLNSQQITVEDSVLHSTDSIKTETIGIPVLGHRDRLLNIYNPFKFLETQSGIQKTGIISSKFSVLGGNYDQNLVIFDDAPIFNPSHLLGYDFIFIPCSIKDVQFYKFYQPSQYGGRLSSVLDIRSKDGNEKNFAIFTEINPIASTVSIETPIVKNHASVILNFRNSNLRWLVHDDAGNALYNYYDGNLKLNFHTKKSRFYYSLYSSGDALNKAGFNSGSYGIKWTNNAHSLRWNQVINSSLFCNVTVYGSEYNYFLYINSGDIAYWNSKISSGGIKTDFTYFKTHDNTIRYGTEISGFQFNPGNIVYSNTQTNLFPTVSSGTIGTLALYFSQNKTLKNSSGLDWGLRMPLSRNAGPTVQYLFNKKHEVVDTTMYTAGTTYNSMASLEPRINYYKKMGAIYYTISYSKTTQVIQEISNSETQLTSLDVWLPASPNIKPQVARQIVVGMSHLGYEDIPISIKVNAFVKSMRNQIGYENHANMLLNPLIEGELRFGKTLVTGGMIDIEKHISKFTVKVDYTYTHTQMRIQKEVVPTIFDRPHDISCGVNYYIKHNIVCAAQWNYLSGKPITTPTSFYEYQGAMVPVYDKMLNSRLPAYHSLDVSLQIVAKKSLDAKWEHIFTFAVKNVYARKNPINISFNKSLVDNEIGVGSEVSEQAEYVSTMLYAGSILPFISYAIKFN